MVLIKNTVFYPLFPFLKGAYNGFNSYNNGQSSPFHHVKIFKIILMFLPDLNVAKKLLENGRITRKIDET